MCACLRSCAFSRNEKCIKSEVCLPVASDLLQNQGPHAQARVLKKTQLFVAAGGLEGGESEGRPTHDAVFPALDQRVPDVQRDTSEKVVLAQHLLRMIRAIRVIGVISVIKVIRVIRKPPGTQHRRTIAQCTSPGAPTACPHQEAR